jgi:hypothetical protein
MESQYKRQDMYNRPCSEAVRDPVSKKGVDDERQVNRSSGLF